VNYKIKAVNFRALRKSIRRCGWACALALTLGSLNLQENCLGLCHEACDKHEWPEIHELVHEVKKNCSIQADLDLCLGSGYSTSSKFSFIESMMLDCPLCGSLVRLLIPTIHAEGEHYLHIARPGTTAHAAGTLSWTAALYHEMGHVVHHDSLTSARLTRQLERFGDHRQRELRLYQLQLADPDFTADLERIVYYAQRGRESIVERMNSTILGSFIAYVLAQDPALWKAPACEVCSARVTFKRGKEQRADLFALDKLWEHGRIDVIMANLYLHGSSGSLRADAYDTHPSGVERALYMLGFLIDKGVDVHALIAEFEQKPLAHVYRERKRYLWDQVKHELIAEHREHEGQA
jgi:hypothetical protein